MKLRARVAIRVDGDVVRRERMTLRRDLRTGADRREVPQIGANAHEHGLRAGGLDVVYDLGVSRLERRQGRVGNARVQQSNLRGEKLVSSELDRNKGWMQRAHCSDLREASGQNAARDRSSTLARSSRSCIEPFIRARILDGEVVRWERDAWYVLGARGRIAERGPVDPLERDERRCQGRLASRSRDIGDGEVDLCDVGELLGPRVLLRGADHAIVCPSHADAGADRDVVRHVRPGRGREIFHSGVGRDGGERTVGAREQCAGRCYQRQVVPSHDSLLARRLRYLWTERVYPRCSLLSIRIVT